VVKRDSELHHRPCLYSQQAADREDIESHRSIRKSHRRQAAAQAALSNAYYRTWFADAIRSKQNGASLPIHGSLAVAGNKAADHWYHK
jgi:hypothetical protein